ncbi:MAG TPA: hypothetical protein VJB38_01610 [Bacteroidota bacterium]|nr:hypothetical protein [Bacteroidota bacterium]
MNRMREIELELERGDKAEREGNSGRARVCARRAVGIALEDYYARMGKDSGKDAVKLLAHLSEEKNVPKHIQDAAHRLQSRVRPDFTSVSEHPMTDARMIIDFLTTVR